MQAPASAAAIAAERPPDRYLVRPAGVLAEILGAEDFGEAELLLRLREAGLIAYPPPLLGEGLLEGPPEVLAAEVLARLDPTDLVVFGQVGRACRVAVVAFGVPQEEERQQEWNMMTGQGTEGGPLLPRVQDFVGSVERLAWAKARGCPMGMGEPLVCVYAAWGGHLEMLQWAREHGCEWNEQTCMHAAWKGHLELLRWAHGHGCPWDTYTSMHAAAAGHLHVLQWVREHGCP
jgi:hypothetical protein